MTARIMQHPQIGIGAENHDVPGSNVQALFSHLTFQTSLIAIFDRQCVDRTVSPVCDELRHMYVLPDKGYTGKRFVDG